MGSHRPLRSVAPSTGGIRWHRALVLTCALVGPTLAQVDDRLWLVQSPVVGTSGQVLEVDRRSASILGSYPGPAGGTCGVVKEYARGHVYVGDAAGGQIWHYRAGAGLLGTIPVPGIVGLTLTTRGDIAVLLDRGLFLPGLVQIVPWDWAVMPSMWPPPVAVGHGARQLGGAGGGVVWVLEEISQAVTRIEAGVATSFPLASFSSAPPAELLVRPDGGVLVTFVGTSIVARLSAQGAPEAPLVLPVVPLRAAIDGEGLLLVFGANGVLTGIDPGGTKPGFSLPTPPNVSVRTILPEQAGRVWVEDGAAPGLALVSVDGEMRNWVPLQYPTSSRGDPLGTEFALKADPDGDADGDGASNRIELLRGSDLLDGNEVPPSLTASLVAPTRRALTLLAASHPLRPALILASLTGDAPLSLGPGGAAAPYFDLVPDLLSAFLAMHAGSLGPTWVAGMPYTQLDANGLATASMETGWVPFAPGTTTFYACAAVWTADGRFVTSNGTSFTN